MSEQELRQLEEFTAIKVMRFEPNPQIEGGYYGERAQIIYRWHPGTDCAQSMELLKRCVNKTRVVCSTDSFEGWAVYNHAADIVASAETLPLAIALFAKKLFEK